MEPFNLDTWLKDKSRKVVTRDGREVSIERTDLRGHFPILAIISNNSEDYDIPMTYNNKGKNIDTEYEGIADLFFADEEEELTEFEKSVQYVLGCYTCKQIEFGDRADNIKFYAKTLLDLARKELEKENSEFKPKFTYNEKDYSKLANKLIEFRNNTPLCSVSYRDGEGRKVILHYEKEILDLARKEVEKEITKEVEQKAINHTYAYQNGYENGKYDALKDLPKWKKSDRNWITNICDLATIVRCDGGDHEDYDSVVVSNRVDKDDYYIELGELLKLPKEE